MGSLGKSARGGASTTQVSGGGAPISPVNGNNPSVQNQVPNSSNTPVTPNAVTNLSSMDDATMAQVVMAARNAQLPNYLNDGNSDTQKFVFQAGINEKPLVLDANEYRQFLRDNNINSADQLARSVSSTSYRNADGTQIRLSGDQINDIIRYSRLNYIGGKHGGTAYGEGTYFAMNGGGSTGYGGTTMTAALNPSTARVIGESALYRAVGNWAQSHPQTARALGHIGNHNESIYALCMGYNVISSGNGATSGPNARGQYFNVIDRSALVILK